ncbi:MAG TPA: Hpt domain-containing protein [Chloroflexota bacterium]|nr:Hpt domain-containing protein [Chloroflexota bacterium]
MDGAPRPTSTPRILLVGLSAELATWLGHRLGGATVVHAPPGRAALDALGQGGWSLLVLDHERAGSAALDLLRRVRAAAATAELPILHCLERAAASRLVPALATRPGVLRLLFQPVEREELARAAAECLGVTLAPAPPSSGDARAMTAAITAMWQRFRAPTLERVAVVEQATTALLQEELDAGLRERAFHEAHRLAGSVGTFGFADGSRLAHEVEQLLRPPRALGTAEALRLADLVSQLRYALEQAPALPGTPAAR